MRTTLFAAIVVGVLALTTTASAEHLVPVPDDMPYIMGIQYTGEYMGCQTHEKAVKIATIAVEDYKKSIKVAHATKTCGSGKFSFVIVSYDGVTYVDSDGDVWRIVGVTTNINGQSNLFVFVFNREVVTLEEYKRRMNIIKYQKEA